MGRIKKKRCRNCRRLFIPDPRNTNFQKYCFEPECRKASKKASRKKWLNKPENKEYFRGPENVKRVQEWRKDNPGYWKRVKKQPALQDLLKAQPTEKKKNNIDFTNNALQDFLRSQPPVIVGLIANITGSALQDDIATNLLRMKKYGQDILCSQPQIEGDANDCKNPDFKVPGSKGAQKFQLDRSSSRAGPPH